jgi:hypothetical protein
MHEIQQQTEARPTLGTGRRPSFDGAQCERRPGRRGHYWQEASRSLGLAEPASAERFCRKLPGRTCDTHGYDGLYPANE